jgi:tetratricopeptide (TPR) repeat protein
LTEFSVKGTGAGRARLSFPIVIFAVLLMHWPCQGQGLSNDSIWRGLATLNSNPALPASEKLRLLMEWKKRSDDLHLPQDSVYARLLHVIGLYEVNLNKDYTAALLSTIRAAQINTSGARGASPKGAVTDLFNVAYYYDVMELFKKALPYYDSAIRYATRTPDPDNVIPESRQNKAYIFFRMGDYEKANEESDLGIGVALAEKDSVHYLSLLNQRAQSLLFQNDPAAAWKSVQAAIPVGLSLHQHFLLGGAYKIEAMIYAKKRAFSQAELSFREGIAERISSGQSGPIAGDYSDLGNFYADSLGSYGKSAEAYVAAIQYAQKAGDSTRMARISINQGRIFMYCKLFSQAIDYDVQAMRWLGVGVSPDVTRNPSLEELSPIANKELLQILYISKTELLLGLYKQTHQQKWLNACLRTAMLNDSLNMQIRHEQLGEQSKLYWRDHTRGLYSDAIEACYYARDDRLAFYFMEKSRSVLLQDKLDEAGAGAYLPPEEAAKRDNMQVGIVEWQQKLSHLADTAALYHSTRLKLLEAREGLEQFIASLETRYPNYYQYKYADKVRSLAELQDFLLKKHQHFIEYFIWENSSFALCIGPDSTRFIKLEDSDGKLGGLITTGLKTCSDADALNRDFPGFLLVAHELYRRLFQPFGLKEGRVVICLDNALLPFETLSKDPVKPDFLVHDFAFSYVYSARYLMSRYDNLPGRGDFLGIAPVHFGAFAGLPDLKQSEEALQNCAGYYKQSKLLLTSAANRENFMHEVSDYKVTTILTHARADSSGDEPQLFMIDSVIHLSELQILNKPATELIVLSACETNAGRNRSGEGIFSLARGFSSAGIPSVAATQWEADEQAIYRISEKFNEYISQGMNKDEALQKAKLYFMQQDSHGSDLPCYWADMILIGNTDPLHFAAGSDRGWLMGRGWAAIALVVMGILALLIFFIRGGYRRESSGRGGLG